MATTLELGHKRTPHPPPPPPKTKRYRDRYGIYYSILFHLNHAGQGGMNTTRLRYLTTTISHIYNETMKKMLECGLIHEEINEYKVRKNINNRARHYFITPKGLRMLTIMDDMVENYMSNDFLLYRDEGYERIIRDSI